MANFLGMWQKWNIHGRLLIYFLLESYRIIAFGQITNIRLADKKPSYIGKVEIYTTSCSSCSSDNWYGVCHDGDDDDDKPSWNLNAATAACRQLGYEAGWNRSETGLTEYYSIEGFNCTDQSTSLTECTYDDTEKCGCDGGYAGLLCGLNDHFDKEQAAVECFDFADVSLYLKDVGLNKKKLVIEYRSELYNVCFHGAGKNWSMYEANVACRQMGYLQGALSTSQLSLTATTHLPGSFADFSCDGDESNLFSCISKPPRPNSCEEIVSLTCQGNRADGTESSTINTGTSEDFSTGPTDRTETSSINTLTSEDFSTGPTVTDRADGTGTSRVSVKNGDFNTRGVLTQDTGKEELNTRQQSNTGMIIGVTVGVISVLVIIIVAVLCHVQYRRKTLLKRATQSQHQQPASTTHPNKAYEAGSAEYADVQDQVRDPNTDYAYAYSHVRNGRVSSTQPATNTTRIGNQVQSGTNSEGWADNAAYNSYGDDGLTNHNADGVVLQPSNLPAQNQTDETEGWAENDAYALRSDDATVSRNQNEEGWQDNNVYVTN